MVHLWLPMCEAAARNPFLCLGINERCVVSGKNSLDRVSKWLVGSGLEARGLGNGGCGLELVRLVRRLATARRKRSIWRKWPHWSRPAPKNGGELGDLPRHLPHDAVAAAAINGVVA